MKRRGDDATYFRHVVLDVKFPETGKPRHKIIEPNEYKMIFDRASD
jgi:hypothetical protein